MMNNKRERMLMEGILVIDLVFGGESEENNQKPQSG
jgi:hypothetical protein